MISDGTVTSLGCTRMPPVQHDVAQSMAGTCETYLSTSYGDDDSGFAGLSGDGVASCKVSSL